MEKLASKDDIAVVRSDIGVLREETNILKEEIEKLKRYNIEITGRLNDLENRGRRNNLIFKGLKYGEKVDYVMLVKNFCTNILGASDEVYVNRAHPLGRMQKNGPIIAHIPNDYDLNYILQCSKKLKNTEYVIHRDFSKDTRAVRSKFFQLKKEITKVVPNSRISVIQDRLVVEGRSFTLDGDRLMDGKENGCKSLLQMTGHDFTEVFTKIVQGQEGRMKNGD